jgi:2-oxo-4-hydroxy-4-carboxy-5-ureidoimidazoline decarboxylase
MTLQELNTVDRGAVRDSLFACCGSRAWVEKMVDLRPFPDEDALLSSAHTVWRALAPGDWLEAFAHHPKIGEKSQAKWSAREQHGMENAAPEIASEMQQLNITYQRKFGYIFIVCASGKSANAMLALLRERLDNPPEAELSIAAAEQSKIMALRLQKLLNE